MHHAFFYSKSEVLVQRRHICICTNTHTVGPRAAVEMVLLIEEAENHQDNLQESNEINDDNEEIQQVDGDYLVVADNDDEGLSFDENSKGEEYATGGSSAFENSDKDTEAAEVNTENGGSEKAVEGAEKRVDSVEVRRKIL